MNSSGFAASLEGLSPPETLGFPKRFRDLERRWFDKAIQRTSSIGRQAGETYGNLPDLAVLREMAEVQHVMSELLGHSALEIGSPIAASPGTCSIRGLGSS